MKHKGTYSIECAINDTASQLRDGADHSPTTIRCAINDLLDLAAKDGMVVNFDYDQARAVQRVKRILSVQSA